ncbi:PD-(D/E)XK nuclease family protein [Verrucomicrobiales bacterium BCK34]|nr:PD-(D/E)XK nuclease family protein [Verrucomicrobiales bacterium BCK34]
MPEPHYSEQTEFSLFDDPPEEKTTAIPSGDHRVFAGWDDSLLKATAAHLIQGHPAKGTLDLTSSLVIVPTKNAGRRLRETLAIRAAERGAAVFPPLVVTPDFLFSPERLPAAAGSLPVATSQIAQWLWTATLLKIPFADFRRVFPVDPVERSLRWASDTASELLAVKRLLAESELTFATAGAILAEEDIEPGRWAELAEIEAIATKEIEACGFREESAAQFDAAANGQLDASITSIFVCGVPDLRPIATKALDHLAKQHSLSILVHAPASEAAHFDRFGRPLPEAWLDREIPVPSPETSIIRTGSTFDQAARAVEMLSDLEDPAKQAAIGIPEAGLSIPLAEALEKRGLKSYDPAGRAIAGEGIYYLIKTVAEVVDSQSFTAFRRLLNCPGAIDSILRRISKKDEKLSGTRLIARFDELIIKTMPERLDDARAGAKRQFSKYPEMTAAIDWMQIWCRRFKEETFDKVLREFLISLYEGKTLDASDITQSILTEVAESLTSLSDDITATAKAFPKPLREVEHFEMLLTMLKSRQVYPEREPDEVDLQGWIELLWEDAPRLIITGMNDHAVPESVVGHSFLPDTARRILGIPSNDDRFSRDAYFLTSMIHSRHRPGEEIKLLFGSTNSGGDPLRPSRLLFQCPIEELPGRTLQLFKEIDSDERTEAKSIAFQLKPLPLESDNYVFQQLSPTSLKQYLSCPFRFYLAKGLKMERVETDKREMNAADFGNLVHNTLEFFARDEEARQLTDAAEIKAYFFTEIDRQLSSQFGTRLSTPVIIQRESARKRLGWWAELEAQHREEGWIITEAEATFGTDEWPFQIGGITVKGRIDRVEKHPELGTRVIDFKTFSPGSGTSRRTVDTYHLTPIKRTESPGDYADWKRIENEEGKELRWTDLQLPLYCLAMAEKHPGTTIHAAYATLGKSEAEIALDVWETLDERLLASAKKCAEGAVAAILAGQFWPPGDDAPPWDEFREILAPEADLAVDSTGLSQ